MSEPVWTKFLTERDRAVFDASGYGTRGGFGKRPALVIIDVNWASAATGRSRSWNRSSAGGTPAAKTPGPPCPISVR